MTVTLYAPQFTLLILLAAQLVVSTANHGRARPPYNAAVAFLDVLTFLGILFWGGFFS